MILAIMHSYIHEQAMMDITPNSSSVIIAGDKCILFLVLVVTVNLLQSLWRAVHCGPCPDM